MHKIEIYSHLDYMTVSYYTIGDVGEIMSPAYPGFKVDEPIKPYPHYQEAYRLKCGAVVNMSDSEMQGARIDLSGEVLSNLRKTGWHDDMLIRELAQSKRKRRTTRADYCFDVHGAGSVRHTVNHWMAGKAKTTFKNAPKGWLDYGTRRGQTIYFGSKESDKFIRVYDKGTEMGLLNEAWLRVELQTRKEQAQALVSDGIKQDMKTAGRTHIKASLDFPDLQWWQVAMKGDTMEKERVGRKETNWQAWMNGQVFDSILTHVKNIEDGYFLEQWLAKVAMVVAAQERPNQ
jgi:hypothetical protein